MKLDKVAERWFMKRYAGSFLVTAAILIICILAGMDNEPLEFTRFDGIFTGAMLIWGMYALCGLLEARRMTREHMGLKPHWTDSSIDELEARVEKLERDRH